MALTSLAGASANQARPSAPSYRNKSWSAPATPTLACRAVVDALLWLPGLLICPLSLPKYPELPFLFSDLPANPPATLESLLIVPVTHCRSG
ncbi:hypothetical protein MRB53_037676 [Persea americana]|nr:hypothetical protein MRB53_037676 [Persea americana]